MNKWTEGPWRIGLPEMESKRETVAVIIASFGPDVEFWTRLGSRAAASVAAQTRPPETIIRRHWILETPRYPSLQRYPSLGTLRNLAAGVDTEADWYCFLDADDELEPQYVEAMLAGTGDVRFPNVRILMDTPDEKIALPPAFMVQPKASLFDGNHIVVGAFIRSSLFWHIGGFGNWDACEDWDLWLRAQISGGIIEHVPGAIYRQHWREGSRNQMERRRYSLLCDEIRKGARAWQLHAGMLWKREGGI